MLDENQIRKLCEKMSIPLACVIPKDKFPVGKKLKTNKAYILNLEDEYDAQGNLNQGSHWVSVIIAEHNGVIKPFFFCPFGMPPPQIVKDNIQSTFDKKTPFSGKNIQSMMANSCGWFVCAFLHYITAYQKRTGSLYDDIEQFLSFFDDLDKSIEFKKNEYILKHFFVSADPALRKKIEVISDTDNIVQDNNGGLDAFSSHLIKSKC